MFTFEKYPRADQNKSYLIESAYYRFEENVHRSDGAGGSGQSKRAGTDSPSVNESLSREVDAPSAMNT